MRFPARSVCKTTDPLCGFTARYRGHFKRSYSCLAHATHWHAVSFNKAKKCIVNDSLACWSHHPRSGSLLLLIRHSFTEQMARCSPGVTHRTLVLSFIHSSLGGFQHAIAAIVLVISVCYSGGESVCRYEDLNRMGVEYSEQSFWQGLVFNQAYYFCFLRMKWSWNVSAKP